MCDTKGNHSYSTLNNVIKVSCFDQQEITLLKAQCRPAVCQDEGNIPTSKAWDLRLSRKMPKIVQKDTRKLSPN